MKSVVITGASAGIGKACAEIFAKNGYTLYLGARRAENLVGIATELQKLGNPKVFTEYLDVTKEDSCKKFVENVLQDSNKKIDILINNAGLALGTDKLVDSKPTDWDLMIQTNVYGLLRMTKSFLPSMIENQRGHIINLGSIAGHVVYEGGSIYTATKHAVRAVTKTLRLELNGTPIRVSSIDPGMVETEFSVVRFQDLTRAKKVYEGMTPLTASDIADAIYYCASRPAHVNIDEIILMPVDQAAIHKVHRKMV